MDWPIAPLPPRDLGNVSTLSLSSIGGNGPGALTLSSLAWPTANRAVFVPFRISAPLLVRQLFVQNGSAVSGNIDLGVYDAVGTRIVSSGSTAQSGTSVLQVIDITDTQLGPGLFYFAVAIDNTTGTVTRISSAIAAAQMTGAVQMASAFPLPATATFAAIATGVVPVIGASGRSVL